MIYIQISTQANTKTQSEFFFKFLIYKYSTEKYTLLTDQIKNINEYYSV